MNKGKAVVRLAELTLFLIGAITALMVIIATTDTSDEPEQFTMPPKEWVDQARIDLKAYATDQEQLRETNRRAAIPLTMGIVNEHLGMGVMNEGMPTQIDYFDMKSMIDEKAFQRFGSESYIVTGVAWTKIVADGPFIQHEFRAVVNAPSMDEEAGEPDPQWRLVTLMVNDGWVVKPWRAVNP